MPPEEKQASGRCGPVSAPALAAFELVNEPVRRKRTRETYTRFSKHMVGPTTLAAPLLILKAKKLSGQGLLRPHLVLTTSVEGTDQPRWSQRGKGLGRRQGSGPGEQAPDAARSLLPKAPSGQPQGRGICPFTHAQGASSPPRRRCRTPVCLTTLKFIFRVSRTALVPAQRLALIQTRVLSWWPSQGQPRRPERGGKCIWDPHTQLGPPRTL